MLCRTFLCLPMNFCVSLIPLAHTFVGELPAIKEKMKICSTIIFWGNCSL